MTDKKNTSQIAFQAMYPRTFEVRNDTPVINKLLDTHLEHKSIHYFLTSKGYERTGNTKNSLHYRFDEDDEFERFLVIFKRERLIYQTHYRMGVRIDYKNIENDILKFFDKLGYDLTNDMNQNIRDWFWNNND